MAHPDDREQALEVNLEGMYVDNPPVDDITHSQGQSQPQLTSPGGLLTVMNNNGPESIQRPASAPPVFPDSGLLESGRHEAGEAFVDDDMDDLCVDRVGYVHVTVPRKSQFVLFARLAPTLSPLPAGRRKHHNPLPLAMSIHCWFSPAVPDVPLCCGAGMASDVARRAYGSLTLLFSRIDSFHSFSYCLPTITALDDHDHDPAPPLPSATRDREQDQTRILADLAKMHNFSPRPELRPFPETHPYLYYLFPPPPTAALIIQSVVHPSLVSVIPISRTIIPEITGTRGRRTAAHDRDSGMKMGEIKGPMYENVPLIDVRTGVVHYPGAGHTSVMTGGVRIGSCGDEEKEVMELLEFMEIVEREEEMNEAQKEDVWRPGTPIPEQPIPHFPSTPVASVHPRLFDYHHHHVQNGYTCASPPSSPVYARRPTLAQFEYPQASQQPAGIVQPIQPPIQFSSPTQRRRPSSHLANEYLPHHQQQQQGTGTAEDPTPKTQRVYGYHPGFPSSFSPAVCAVSTPVPPSPAPYMAPALAPPSYGLVTPYAPQPSPGPYAWYGVSAIGGNAYTPAPDANANNNGHGYFRPASVPAHAPLPPIQAPQPAAPTPAIPLELALPTMTAPDSNNAPQQVFYTTRDLEAHFLRDPEHTVLRMPPTAVHGPPAPAPVRPKRGVRRVVGKQATIGLDGTISHGGGFRTSEPLEEPHPHPHPDPHPHPYLYPDPVPAVTVTAVAAAGGIERPASVPPILEDGNDDDDDDMMTVEVSAEAGARANRKRKRDQLAWDYRDETAGDGNDYGGGGGGEGVSDDEAMFSADERKRARIGHSHGESARRRSFGDDKRPSGSVVRAFFNSFLTA